MMVWAIYYCPFGCGKTHRETMSSEAMAYWYGVHGPDCTALKEVQNA
jgi:hypothetical protein